MTNEHPTLAEYRCYQNGKLLCKAAGNVQIEIINPSNRILNYVGPSRKHQDEGPKGVEFAMKCVDLNCKGCKRLTAKAIGTDGVVEIKCRYCKETTLWDLEKMQRGVVGSLSEYAKKQFNQQRGDDDKS